MPWAPVFSPSLGLSVLKSNLARKGIPVDVRYFNLSWTDEVAKRIAGDGTGKIDIESRPSRRLFNFLLNDNVYGMVDEWLFARHLFGKTSLDTQDYLSSILKNGYSPEEIKLWISLANLVGPFLEKCLKAVSWSDYDCVGFTTTYHQVLASLALARLVKENHPRLQIVMGGANCRGDMGKALLRHFGFLDYIISGEGDESFPDLLNCLDAGRTPDGIKGVIWRKDGEPVLESELATGTTMEDLDTLPYPDFDDYFAQRERTVFAKEFDVHLPLEQSRGCWWGMHSHCTFCGHRSKGVAFRAKSPKRAWDELFYIGKRYGHRITKICYSDNILSMKHFDTFLPRLAATNHPYSLFYEVKSNLRKNQIELLRRAGVKSIQPGIESLSSKVLKLMAKGVTALQNVQCMKWCHQFGVVVRWNLLYGFPGETVTDYEQTLSILESIPHLDPPASISRVHMVRFSPNFEKAAEMGFVNVRPLRPYTFIFPFSQQELMELVYYFDCDLKDGSDPEKNAVPARRFVESWKKASNPGTLDHILLRDQGALIRDRRFNRADADYRLTPLENRIYMFCDSMRSLERIEAEVGQADAGSVSGILERFVEERLMVCEGPFYLSVALVRSVGHHPLFCSRGLGCSNDAAVPSGGVLDSPERDDILKVGELERCPGK
jgi:ribosomal peptide maturation radical SAM protein 1